MNHNKPDVYLIPESFYYRSRAENLFKPAKLLFPLILEEYRKAFALNKQDESGGVYCELPVEKAMQALTCSRQTAINAFQGIGAASIYPAYPAGAGTQRKDLRPSPAGYFFCPNRSDIVT